MRRTADPRPVPAPLSAWVKTLWVSDTPAGPTAREAVLPTGSAHLVFRLSGAPVKVFEERGAAPTDVGHAVIGGPRGAAYVRDVSEPVRSIGVQLRPGAASLLGVPATELAGRHVALADLWGPLAGELLERLLEAGSPEAQLQVVESLLLARLARAPEPSPVVRWALQRFERGGVPVAVVVRETGYSHRRFTELFRAAVGLSPKRYCRVLRLQRALPRLASAAPLADVALEAGYADQAHLTRDFGEIAGLPPGAYRAARPGAPSHVPLGLHRR